VLGLFASHRITEQLMNT